jgi:hypothetical protein
MEVMGYDFFTPGPVKGAEAYLQMVLHDWPGTECEKILAAFG